MKLRNGSDEPVCTKGTASELTVKTGEGANYCPLGQAKDGGWQQLGALLARIVQL